MQCVTLLLILVDTGLKELYLPLLVTGSTLYNVMGVKTHLSVSVKLLDKPYSPGCNHLCPMWQFGSKHVCIEDVHIFKYCHEMTLFLLWIGTYCISCVVQQTSGVKDLSSLVRYDDSSLAAIRHVQSIKPLVRPRPNIRSHSVLSQRLLYLNFRDTEFSETLLTLLLVHVYVYWTNYYFVSTSAKCYCFLSKWGEMLCTRTETRSR